MAFASSSRANRCCAASKRTSRRACRAGGSGLAGCNHLPAFEHIMADRLFHVDVRARLAGPDGRSNAGDLRGKLHVIRAPAAQPQDGHTDAFLRLPLEREIRVLTPVSDVNLFGIDRADLRGGNHLPHRIHCIHNPNRTRRERPCQIR
jgi:hypothetical protein